MEEKIALIGKTLKHSYSKPIHQLLGDYTYDLCELEKEDLEDFVKGKKYKGFNITIPYKKDIMPFLDSIDGRAKQIGAVNTVVYKNGKSYGYNTDFNGVIYMLSRANIIVKDKVVLIMGSGGTCLTALAVFNYLGAKKILFLSRNGEINYQNYMDKVGDVEVLFNATPVGMYPNNLDCLVDLDYFTSLKAVVDAIYNPSITALLFQARKKNLLYTNGLPMLVAQAKYAMELFFDKKVDDSVINPIIEKLERQSKNIVLIGMPGSGKSTIGKILAKKLCREFVDSDALIEKNENKSIPDIFSTYGEDYFRQKEKLALIECCKLSKMVIATGGGVVKDPTNYNILKQNGILVYIKRDIDKLSSKGRPLSKDKESIKRLFEERKDSYNQFADFTVENNGDITSAVNKVIDIYENFSD